MTDYTELLHQIHLLIELGEDGYKIYIDELEEKETNPMKDDISIWDLEPEGNWEGVQVTPNEICPKCGCHNIYMQRHLDYYATQLEPAEYSYKGGCKDCGEDFEFPELLEECTCRPETQYGLSGEACDYCKGLDSNEIPF